MRSSLSTSLAAIASSALLCGCAGGLDHPERFAYLGEPDAGPPPAVTSDGGCDPVGSLFPLNCTTGACHSAQTQQANLDLESPGLPRRLLDKQAHGGPGLLIDSKDPAQSVLYLKVTDTPPFQFQMPLGAPALAASDQACLLSWVQSAPTAP